MSSIVNKNNANNGLWLSRKRLGLGQKQIAYLLGHKTTDQVSRYEQGRRIPGLKLLLQMEIIFGVPGRVLYQEYYSELKQQILKKVEANKSIREKYSIPEVDTPHLSEYCSFAELLQNPRLPVPTKMRIHKHNLKLMNETALK